jgi:hypothetical protein
MLTCIYTRPCGGLLLAGLLVISSGCSGAPERATVKGKVTLGDKALTVGSVMFLGKDNLTGTAAIDKDGNYVLSDAPVGEARISVTVPNLPPGGLQRMKQMINKPGVKPVESVDPNDSSKRIEMLSDLPDNIVTIPSKYSIPAESGLTYTIKPGEQTYDIKLAP